MVQLEIRSGKTAGTRWEARRFPVRIGRSPGSDVQLEEPGVWDDHLTIRQSAETGLIVEAQPNALVLVNGQSVQSAPLRNGDEIDVGAVKLRFWLAPAVQRESVLNEIGLWTIVLGVCVAQIWLIYWLATF